MKPILSLLLFQASDEDVLSIIRELYHHHFNLSWKWVKNTKQLQIALAKQSWDLIISNHQDAGLNAFDVLKILQSSKRDIPLIVISEVIEDSLAVDLMQAGAVDCFVKGNTTRLPEVIRREIREAQIRREQRLGASQLEAVQERLQLAIESSGLGLWDWFIDRGEVTLNERWADMIGYTLEELAPIQLGTWQKYTHPEDWPKVVSALDSHFQNQTSAYECELRMRHRSGHWVWVLARGKVVERDATGRPLRITGTHLDITERKESESLLSKRERYLTAIVEIQKQLLSNHTDQNIYQTILEILGPIAGADRIYVFEKHQDRFGNSLISQHGEWCRPGIQSQLSNPQFQNLRCHPESNHCLSQLTQGQLINSLVSDVSMSEFQVLIAPEVAAVLMLPLMVDGQFFGFIGFDRVTPDLWDAIEINPLSSVAAAIALFKERELAVRALARLNQELEERVEQRTAALQDSEARLQAIIDFAPAVIYVKDLQGRHTLVNRSFLKFFSCTKREILGKTNQELFEPELAKILSENDNEVYRLGRFQQYEEEAEINGRFYTFLSNKFLLLDRDWQPYGLCGISVNITSRKEAEKAIQRQLAMMEAAIDGIALIENGQLTYANQAHANLLGFDQVEELIGQPWQQFYDPLETERFEQHILPQLQRDRSWQGEAIARRKDGSTFYEGLSLTLSEDGTLICVCRDISHQKHTEAQLTSLSNRLALALQSAAIGTWEWNFQDEVQWDSRIREIYGWHNPDRDPTYQDWLNCLHPEDAMAMEAFRESIMNHQGELNLELRINRPNGEQRFVQCFAIIEHDTNHQPLRMVGVNYDITEHKQAEHENQSLKERLEFVLSSNPAIIYTCQLGENYRFTFVSRNIESILGYPKEEFLQNHAFWLEHIHPEDLTYVLDSLHNLNDLKYHVREYRFLKSNGSYCWLHDEFRVVYDTQGKPLELVGYFADISDRKDTEEALKQTNAQLERATRLKDEFLASMSHELRTPLNAILGMSESLQEDIFGPITPEQTKAVATIEKSGRHLLELINDILDLSKIEANRLELDLDLVSVWDLCENSLAFVKQLASQKKIALKASIAENLRDLSIQVDGRRMRQVLINLLSNAVKFTPDSGAVELVVMMEEAPQKPPYEPLDREPISTSISAPIEASNSQASGSQASSSQSSYSDFRPAQICFTVRDTGIGIAPENLSKLFQSFVQIDSRLSRQYAGTGLGLALVKRITELHGGRVSVRSEVGQGSCFQVYLPCWSKGPTRSPSASEVAPGLHSSLPACNGTQLIDLQAIETGQPLILLAEDNEANIMTISSYLKAQNYQILSAQNGREAIEMVRSHQPALVLMDIQMPEMDGLTAIAQIRQDPDFQSLPIIALTALAMAGDQERCLQAGATAYLNKPVKLKQLANMIQELLKQ